MSIKSANRSLQERAERMTRPHHPTEADEAAARRHSANDQPGTDVPEDALEVYEALVEAVGLQAARTALHVLDGFAPKLATIDRLMARRRLPELLQRRPDASTRDLGRWLGVSHATVQRWLNESGTPGRTRSGDSS